MAKKKTTKKKRVVRAESTMKHLCKCSAAIERYAADHHANRAKIYDLISTMSCHDLCFELEAFAAASVSMAQADIAACNAGNCDCPTCN